MSRRTYILSLILTSLIGLFFRLWLWHDQGQAGMIYPGDQDEYYRGAIHLLLQGDYYDDGQWLRPPVMSFFLTAVFAIVGVNIPTAMAIQCVVSVLTTVIFAALARSIFESCRAGVAAAALGAIFPPYASYASQLFSETLFVAALAGAFLLFEVARKRQMYWPWLLAGGVVWAIATLTRPISLYATPLLILWVMWVAAGRGKETPQQLGTAIRTRLSSFFSPSAIIPAVALLIGFVVVLAPWSIRNYLVYDQVVLVDTNGGVSFWLGNLLEPNERELQGVWNDTIPNSAVRQQVAMARALDNIAREPLTFLTRMRYKVVSLWQFDIRLFAGNGPIGITLDERSIGFAFLSDAVYLLILVLAVGGVMGMRRANVNLPLLMWPLYGTLLSAISLGHPRLRLPLMITLLVYGAYALAHPRIAFQRVAWGRWYRKAGAIGGAVVMAGLLYSHAYLPFLQSQWWLLVSRLGDGTHAIERAFAAAPDHYAPAVACGDWHYEHQRWYPAFSAYRTAAEYAPQLTSIQLRLLDTARRLGDEEGVRSAMQQIAAVGWDNNQLYAWAWDRFPAAADHDLSLATPAAGVMQGVSATTVDEAGHPFRWTTGRADMRFQPISSPRSSTDPYQQTISFLVRAPAPNTPVDVFYQQQKIATVVVGDTWQTKTVPFPEEEGNTAGREASTIILSFEAPLSVESVTEPYPRGVAVAKVWIQ